jgi:hypothetical protein
MNKSYLSSIMITIFSLKPSKAIRLLLMVLFVYFFANLASAQGADCANATSLTINGACDNGTISDVTQNLPNISGCSAGAFRREGWYTFTVAGGSLDVTITGVTTNRNLFLQLISSTGSCTGLSQINCANNDNANNSAQTEVISTTLSNGIYYIKVVNAGNNNIMVLSSICVTAIPTIFGFTPNNGCSNSTSVVITGTNFTGVSAVRFGGTNAASYVVNSSTQITAIPAAGTSGSISVITSGGTATSGSNFVVNTPPVVNATASLSTLCNGGSVTLNASATPTTQNTVLFYEGFNGATNSWFKSNTSSGGTPANAAWVLRPDGYSYAYVGFPTRVFQSNDNSQFYLSNSAAQGNATTATILQSPLMNTIGYTSLSLEFYQYNLDFDATDFANVEVSTNGSTWTTLSTTTTTQGSENNFLRTTINLDAYINQTTLYVRFKYDAQFDWFWAIDNVTVSGNKTIDYAYSWTALLLGTAGLPPAAGTPSTTNNSIVANPTETTVYTVTATSPITGCSGTTTVNTTVNTAPIVYAITGSGNFCASSTGAPIGLSDSEIGVNYQLVKNSLNVGSVVAGTASSISFGLQNSAGDYTVVATKNSTFCSATMTGVVTISSLPPVPVGTTIVDTSCSTSTGSITLTNQNHGLEFVKTTSQYISTTAPFLSNLAAFTMEGWIKFKTSDLNMGLTSLFGQNDVIEFGFQGGQLHLYTLNGGNIYVTPPANLGGNTWHHIAAVGTGSQILIYVDGIVVGSGGYATSNYGSYTDNVNIGAGVFNPTGDFFAGQIMKVGFYNTALSGTRIASLAYSPITYTGTETGLIAGYNFLEGSGTTLTSLPASKNGTLVNVPIWRDPYIYSWTKAGTPTYAATTRNVTGLSSGSYNLSFDIGKGCSRTVSYSVGTLEATWNGASWSSSPTVNHNLIFNGNYLPAANPKVDINGCSCTVNTGKNVTINPGHNLILSGDLTVLGTLTFENNASLVQTNNAAVNSGNIIYKRQTSSVRNTDYTYWSSPVAGHTLDISTSYVGGMFFSFNDFAIPENWKGETASTSMQIGKGYIIRGPEISSPPLSPPPPPGMCMATFTGVPNNGIKDISIGPTGNSNLIGNPYPSAIYADQFLFDNQSVIEGTIYFWTHNTPIAIGTPDPGTGVWAYSGNDYATYTLTGGTGTAKGSLSPEWVDADKDRVVDPSEFRDKNGNGTLDTSEWTDSNSNKTLETNEWTDTNKNNIAETEEWTDNNKNGILDSGEWTDLNSNSIKDFGEWTDTNGNGVFNTGEWTDTNGDKRLNLEVVQVSNKPTGKIAAGQGFFTTSITTGGTVTFANEMRVDGSGNPLNNTFFYKIKNSKAKTNNSIEKNRVWLNLTNTQGAFKQALVGYITGATNTWDNLYDGESFDGNNFLDFYSINDEKNLTIQGRALPFDENDEIPLGYRIAVEGTFTIGIDESDGKLENQPIFIEDKLTNTVFDLKRGKYTFKTVAGTFNDRFILRYTNKTLGTNENELAKNKIIVSVKKKQIKIDSFAETIDKISIYDLLGRKIYQKDKVNSNQFIITDLVSRQEIFIVKTTLLNGNSVSNKIIY